jgi:peroxiredoxin
VNPGFVGFPTVDQIAGRDDERRPRGERVDRLDAAPELAAGVDHVPFSILVDAKFAIAEAFGVVHALPEYLRELYKNVFDNDLSLVNAAGDWRLPIPARFVIAQDGTIVDVEADADYRYRPDPQSTVASLSSISPEPAR